MRGVNMVVVVEVTSSFLVVGTGDVSSITSTAYVLVLVDLIISVVDGVLFVVDFIADSMNDSKMDSVALSLFVAIECVVTAAVVLFFLLTCSDLEALFFLLFLKTFTPKGPALSFFASVPLHTELQCLRTHRYWRTNELVQT